MNLIKLEFTNASGQKLAARLDLPGDEKPLAYAIFAHCFTCSKNTKAIAHISRALTREGLAVLRFDFTGLGESQGNFADTNFSSNVQDLISAAEFLEAGYEAPRLLVGHSFGGAAVLQAASRLPVVAAVVAIAAPADPAYVAWALGSTQETIEQQGEADVNLAGRSFRIKKQFLDDLQFVNLRTTLQNLNCALLVLHSPLDGIVGIDNAAKIFQAARHPKSFVSLDRADHLLTDPSDSRYAGSVIAVWAMKYIAPSAAREPQKKN